MARDDVAHGLGTSAREYSLAYHEWFSGKYDGMELPAKGTALMQLISTNDNTGGLRFPAIRLFGALGRVILTVSSASCLRLQAT